MTDPAARPTFNTVIEELQKEMSFYKSKQDQSSDEDSDPDDDQDISLNWTTYY